MLSQPLPLPTPTSDELTEIAQKTHIVAFHTDTHADQHTPCHSLGVQSDALEQGHLPLFLSGIFGIVNDFVHALGMGEVIFGWEVERTCCRAGSNIVLFGIHGGNVLGELLGEKWL